VRAKKSNFSDVPIEQRKKRARDLGRETRRVYQLQRRRTDVQYRIALNIRARVYSALKGRAKGGAAVRDLGCSIPEFIEYIAGLFQTGMVWDNYGPQWHLDHIKPLISFDLTDPEQFKEACITQIINRCGKRITLKSTRT